MSDRLHERDEELRTDGGRDVAIDSKWCPVCDSPTLWNGQCNRTGCPGPDATRLSFDGGTALIEGHCPCCGTPYEPGDYRCEGELPDGTRCGKDLVGVGGRGR